jgi:hypothetical protein
MRRMLGSGREHELGGVAAEVGAAAGDNQDAASVVSAFGMSTDGEQVLDVDDWLDEEEQDEAAADQAALFAELPDQELSAAEQSSSDEEELTAEYLDRIKGIKLNSAALWAKPATSKQAIRFVKGKRKVQDALEANRVVKRQARAVQQTQKRLEAGRTVKELEEVEADSGRLVAARSCRSTCKLCSFISNSSSQQDRGGTGWKQQKR